MARMTNAQLLQLAMDLRSELDILRADLASARREAEILHSSARSELDAFKQLVREIALEAKKENNWCDAGFNSVMEQLGLEPLPTMFNVTVTVTATREITVELPADDLEEESCTTDGAEEFLGDTVTLAQYISEELGYGDWELTDVQIDGAEAVTN
jgi:hypothetical protein